MEKFKANITNLTKEHVDFTHCSVLVKYPQPTSYKIHPKGEKYNDCLYFEFLVPSRVTYVWLG